MTELEDVVKEHSDTIKDSTLCGMKLDDFYKAMVSVVFPGFTIFYAEDERYNNDIEYSPDDVASILYSARIPSIKRTYYIGNGISEAIPIPEFAKDDQRLAKDFAEIAGISFRPYSKHPLYVRAKYLARFIRIVDEFVKFSTFSSNGFYCYRPSAVIEGLSPCLKYRIEPFSDLAVTVIKWLTALCSQGPVDNRNIFVDYLANNECYHELYVELVQFIHKHLTQQKNTAKFEL